MDDTGTEREKARPTTISLYPKHDALIYALQMHRASQEPNKRIVPKVSELFQEALVVLARQELPEERVLELMAGVA